MRYFVTLPGCDEMAVDVVQRPGGTREVRVDGELVDVNSVDVDGAMSVLVGDHVIDLWADDEGRVVSYSTGLERALAQVESERARIGASASRRGAAGGGTISAPMPGRVIKVLVEQGDEVAAGTPIIVVEAMKMENELCCETPGRVKTIHATAGQTVESGAPLVELGPLDE